jgi:hypothetical protein
MEKGVTLGGNGGKWKAGKLQSTGMGKNTSALMLLFATRARKKGFGALFLILFMRMCVVFSSRRSTTAVKKICKQDAVSLPSDI